LMGVHRKSRSAGVIYRALLEWGSRLNRDPSDVLASTESCIRQNVLMSLIPHRAVDPRYAGSIDVAVEEHLASLAIDLSPAERIVLRNICLHIRKYHGLDKRAARRITMSLGAVRLARGSTYQAIRAKQNGRCCWCGALFQAPGVVESLEHLSPKLIGDDLADGSNWGLSCLSCNSGKAGSLGWATQSASQDYLERPEFADVSRLGLAQRWAVLCRVQRCDHCASVPRNTSLWVYRKVKTGLPIPSHCSVTCEKCGAKRKCDLLIPRWDDLESGRLVPQW